MLLQTLFFQLVFCFKNGDKLHGFRILNYTTNILVLSQRAIRTTNIKSSLQQQWEKQGINLAFFSGKLIIKNIQGIIFRSSSPYIHSLQFHVIMHIADTLVLLTSSPKQEVTRGCHLKEKTTLFMSRCGWKAAMHRPVRRRDNSQVWETS